MMSVVVDIQCLMQAGGEYIVKELSVVDMYYYSSSHWLFKPPKTDGRDLKSLKTNYWLSKNLHFLNWEDGYIEYEELFVIMSFIALNYNRVYVKGLQKKNVLSKFISESKVINLEDYGCPKLATLIPRIVNVHCINHSKTSKACTHYRAYAILSWMKEYK